MRYRYPSKDVIIRSVASIVETPWKVFLLFVLPVGLSIVFLVPPLAGNDEISHVSRAYEISHGQLITQQLPNGNYGGEVPTEFIKLYRSNSFDALRIDHDAIRSAAHSASTTSINTNDTTPLAYSGAALYSPLAYLPHVIALKIAQFFNASILSSIYLIRVFVLLSFALLVAFALWLIPKRKYFLLTIALLPTSVLLAGIISTDAILLGTLFIIIASSVYIFEKRNPSLLIHNRPIYLLIIVSICALYVAVSKVAYVIIVLLLLFPLLYLYKNRPRKLAVWAVSCLAIPIIAALSWFTIIAANDYGAGQRLSVNSVGIYPPTADQAVHEVVANPLRFPEMLYHTYVDDWRTAQDIPNYIMQSWSGMFTEYKITPALWFTLLVVFTLLLAFSIREPAIRHITTYHRLATAIAMVLVVAAISFSMYLYATTANSANINGIQGRYFLPLLPYVVLLFPTAQLMESSNTHRTKGMLIGCILITNLFMLHLLRITFL